MKLAIILSVLLTLPSVVTAAASATARPPTDQPPRLQGAQCLDPGLARSWIDVDRDRLLVDTGRYRYLVTLKPACTAMASTQVLRFRGDPVSGRVCGNIGDAVVTRDYPCQIGRMELISKDQYRQLLDERSAIRKARRDARKAAKGS